MRTKEELQETMASVHTRLSDWVKQYPNLVATGGVFLCLDEIQIEAVLTALEIAGEL